MRGCEQKLQHEKPTDKIYTATLSGPPITATSTSASWTRTSASFLLLPTMRSIGFCGLRLAVLRPNGERWPDETRHFPSFLVMRKHMRCIPRCGMRGSCDGETLRACGAAQTLSLPPSLSLSLLLLLLLHRQNETPRRSAVHN